MSSFGLPSAPFVLRPYIVHPVRHPEHAFKSVDDGALLLDQVKNNIFIGVKQDGFRLFTSSLQ